MPDSIIVLSLFSTVFILVAMIHVYVYFRLKSLLAQLNAESYQLYFDITSKSDLIPLFIEKLKQHNSSLSFEKLIEARKNSMSYNALDKRKQELEDRLWQLYKEFAEQSQTLPNIKQDHLFSSVMFKLNEFDVEYEKKRENYNRIVRQYNKIACNPLLKFAAIIAGAKRKNEF